MRRVVERSCAHPHRAAATHAAVTTLAGCGQDEAVCRPPQPRRSGLWFDCLAAFEVVQSCYLSFGFITVITDKNDFKIWIIFFSIVTPNASEKHQDAYWIQLFIGLLKNKLRKQFEDHDNLQASTQLIIHQVWSNVLTILCLCYRICSTGWCKPTGRFTSDYPPTVVQGWWPAWCGGCRPSEHDRQ